MLPSPPLPEALALALPASPHSLMQGQLEEGIASPVTAQTNSESVDATASRAEASRLEAAAQTAQAQVTLQAQAQVVQAAQAEVAVNESVNAPAAVAEASSRSSSDDDESVTLESDDEGKLEEKLRRKKEGATPPPEAPSTATAPPEAAPPPPAPLSPTLQPSPLPLPQRGKGRQRGGKPTSAPAVPGESRAKGAAPVQRGQWAAFAESKREATIDSPSSAFSTSPPAIPPDNSRHSSYFLHDDRSRGGRGRGGRGGRSRYRGVYSAEVPDNTPSHWSRDKFEEHASKCDEIEAAQRTKAEAAPETVQGGGRGRGGSGDRGGRGGRRGRGNGKGSIGGNQRGQPELQAAPSLAKPPARALPSKPVRPPMSSGRAQSQATAAAAAPSQSPPPLPPAASHKNPDRPTRKPQRHSMKALARAHLASSALDQPQLQPQQPALVHPKPISLSIASQLLAISQQSPVTEQKPPQLQPPPDSQLLQSLLFGPSPPAQLAAPSQALPPSFFQPQQQSQYLLPDTQQQLFPQQQMASYFTQQSEQQQFFPQQQQSVQQQPQQSAFRSFAPNPYSDGAFAPLSSARDFPSNLLPPGWPTTTASQQISMPTLAQHQQLQQLFSSAATSQPQSQPQQQQQLNAPPPLQSTWSFLQEQQQQHQQQQQSYAQQSRDRNRERQF